MKAKTFLPSLSCLLTYTIFGFSFLFSRIALDYTTPPTLLAIRFLVAFAVLNLLCLFPKNRLHLRGKPVGKLLLMGFVQPILYYTCENYGIAKTSASFSGILLGTIPVIGLLLGRIFLHEKCTPFRIACAVLSVVGVALTTVGGETIASPVGTVLLLLAAGSSAYFTVLSRSISGDFTPFERTYMMFALGSLFFTGLAVFQNRGDLSALFAPLRIPAVCGSVLYLSVVSSVLAFFLLNYAMQAVSVGTASVFSNFCTVVSLLAGVLLLHESFSVPQIIGICIILLSVFGVSMPEKSKSAQE